MGGCTYTKKQGNLDFALAHAPELMNGLNYLRDMPGSKFDYEIADLPVRESYYGQQARSLSDENEGVQITLWRKREGKGSKPIKARFDHPLEYCVMKNGKIVEVVPYSESVDAKVVTQVEALTHITEKTAESGALREALGAAPVRSELNAG
jgi:hypothetical protein